MDKKRRFSKKLCRFICDKISSGMNLEEICRTYPEEVPKSRTVKSWQQKYPWFRDEMTDAYSDFMFVKMDELDELTRTPLDKLYPELDNDRLKMEARRARMDALKFLLNSVAPALNNRWNKAQKVEVKGKLDAPQIVIQSYSTKLPKDITPAPNQIEDKS